MSPQRACLTFTMTSCPHNDSLWSHSVSVWCSQWLIVMFTILLCVLIINICPLNPDSVWPSLRPLFSHNNSPCLHNNCVWSPRDSGRPSQWLCKPSQWLVCPQIDCLTLTLCNHHNDSMWHSWWLWTSQWFCVMFIMTYCDPQNEFIWPKMIMCYFMYVCMYALTIASQWFWVILTMTLCAFHNDLLSPS